MSAALLDIRSLTVTYGPVVAVSDLDLAVGEGETVVLAGANGAGKSSTIRAVIGLAKAKSGSVTFHGEDITKVRTSKRATMGIRLSPEGRQVFGRLTVEDNVRAGMHQLGRAARARMLAELCDTFPLIHDRRRSLASELSGGQQQVVALARALASSPRLLLLDEPFLGLAPIWIQSTSEAIRRVQERGTAILLSEQMARPALALATRGYVLRQGRVTAHGTADEIRRMALADEYV